MKYIHLCRQIFFIFPRETFDYIFRARRKNGIQSIWDGGIFEQAKKCPLIVDGKTTEPGFPEGSRVDLHNYTVMIYDDSPDLLSPEEGKFLARAP